MCDLLTDPFVEHLRQNADGSYNDFRVNDRWFAWQAAMRYRDEQENGDGTR